MKKHLSLILLLTILASGCSQEEILKNESTSSDSRKFTASFEQNESRTYIEEGNLLRWTAGDLISLFNSNTLNQQYKFDGETGANSGTFSKVESPFGTGNDLDCHYAIYPYDSNITITESGVITATLPATQSYAANSFGLGANTMVAVTEDTDDTFLKFQNVGGYLKLQLYGDDVTVKSITLTGNNDEKLAGTATITPVYGQVPTISMADDATNSIILNCGDGVEIGTTTDDATAFWIVIPPTTFENGFEITITDVNGNEMTQSTSNEITISRNVIKPMAAFEVETAEVIPTNQIWYTSSDSQVVTLYATDGFGANIYSNIYENGKGIITFDADVTMIGSYAFLECQKLTSVSIPNSVTVIGDNAFAGCTSLTNITLPNSVTNIAGYAFWDCTSLTNITLPNSVTNLGKYAFKDCSSLTSIIISNSVTTINEYTFYGCSSLTNVTIPNSVTTVGDGAFNNCTSLTSITNANSVTDIGGWAFADCTSLTNITLPNSVTTINHHAFSGCNSLTSITIPNSVTTISYGIFIDCSSLTSITIPSSVTYIGTEIFIRCTSLESIIVEEGNSVYDSRNNCNAIIETTSNKLISGCKKTIIPNDVATIATSAFDGCSSLTSIVIPNSVTSIGSAAFRKCASLTNITIPYSVTTIGNQAFNSCVSLAEVHIEATTPPTIYSYTFTDCSNDLKIYVPTESLATYQAADYWNSLNLLTK